MSEIHVLGMEGSGSALIQVAHGDDPEVVWKKVKERAPRFSRLFLIRPDFAVYELIHIKGRPAIEEVLEIGGPHPRVL